MRGRSVEQVAEYERQLDELVAMLTGTAMTVREIRDVLAVKVRRIVVRPAAATVHAWIESLVARGHVVRRSKRRRKIAGKSGTRERVYWIDDGSSRQVETATEDQGALG